MNQKADDTRVWVSGVGTLTSREMAKSLEDFIWNQQEETGTKLLELGHRVWQTANGNFEISVKLDGKGIGEIELTADRALLLAIDLTNKVRNYGLK